MDVIAKTPWQNRSASINVRGKLLTIYRPWVMGILNITPDSFHDGGQYLQTEKALKRAIEMLEEGASIIDIGGMSSRPGASISHPEEELKRVLPVVVALLNSRPDAVISIDTLHAEVAEACLEAGAAIINDISAGSYDTRMLEVAASFKAPIVLMHMQGLPENMQDNPRYQNVVADILDFFNKKVDACLHAGIHDIIIDPGFGFGKTTEHNFSMLRHLDVFGMLGFPIMAGLSRKSMIWRTLDTDAAHALNGTTALHMIALMKGATFLRVHDVKEAMECVRLYEAIQNSDL